MATRAKPKSYAMGSEPTTRDRGMTDVFMHPSSPGGRTKARVSGSGMMMKMNEAGKHSRRAPKSDRLV